MAFGLYSLLEAALLVLNAICVLHEERFLAKVEQFIWKQRKYWNTDADAASPLQDPFVALSVESDEL